MGKSTVCAILKETCEVLWNVLMPQYVRAPSSAAEWKGVSQEFEKLWHFPHCIGNIPLWSYKLIEYSHIEIDTGAIDGKHVVLQAPSMLVQHTLIIRELILLYFWQCVMHITGEYYVIGIYNLMYFEICRFILVDIGEVGRHSDGGVLSNSSFGEALEAGALFFPEPCALTGGKL